MNTSSQTPASADAPLRIFYVTTEFVDEDTLKPQQGGLASYLAKITRLMAARGHEPHVLLFGSRRTHSAVVDGIPVHFLDKSYRYSRLQRLWMHVLPERALANYQSDTMGRKIADWLRREHRQRRIDIVQYASHGATGRFPVREIPNCVRISSFARLWQRHYGYSDPLEIRDEEMQFRKARFMYGPSAAIARQIKDDLRLDVDVRVIETPFLPSEEKPDGTLLRRVGEGTGGDPYLLFFGTVGRLKGGEEIAASVHDFLGENPGLHLVLVGKVADGGADPSLDDIRRRACEHASRVHWLGPQPHARLMPVVGGALAVLLPSRVDNLPNTCIESMGLGKVVIGSRGASFEQLIDDGRSGILCRAGDAASVTDAVRRLMRLSEPARREMEAAARRRIALLHPDVIVPQVESFYRVVIAKWRRQMV